MAKTRAQIAADFRAKKKEDGYTARLIWVRKGEPTPDTETPQEGEEAKRELEAVKAQLKQADRRAQKAERAVSEALTAGKTQALCSVADYLVGKGTAGIAKAILERYYIGRTEAEKYVESMTVKSLDKAGIWGEAVTANRP
jgi:hypothetical protein